MRRFTLKSSDSFPIANSENLAEAYQQKSLISNETVRLCCPVLIGRHFAVLFKMSQPRQSALHVRVS
jgi:hypothetical protein